MSQEARRLIASSERLDPPPRTNADIPERLRIRRFSEGVEHAVPDRFQVPRIGCFGTGRLRPGDPLHDTSGSDASAAGRIIFATTIRVRCTWGASTTSPLQSRERSRDGWAVRPREVADQLVGQPELEPDAFGSDPAVVLTPLRLAVLDLAWMARMAPYPEVTAEIATRLMLRARRPASLLAIAQQHRLEDRLLLLSWQIAGSLGASKRSASSGSVRRTATRSEDPPPGPPGDRARGAGRGLTSARPRAR